MTDQPRFPIPVVVGSANTSADPTTTTWPMRTASGRWLWFVETIDGQIGIYTHPTEGPMRLLAGIPPVEPTDD